MRQESDALGARQLPEGALYGIHTLRAVENFPLSETRLFPEFIRAYAMVKAACAKANLDTGHLDPGRAGAIVAACDEIAKGRHADQFPVDPYQGGAGTSTNMNVNEVVANRALQLLGRLPGEYDFLSPLGHVNLHQSTNDTYPTALKVAALWLLKELEAATARLQEAFQEKEAAFAHVVKVGRTECMDAVPLTLGMEFGAFAEAISRDRWRIFKCRERIKQVSLGGTAVGTGLGAPREFIFRAAEHLRNLTGLPLSRAENLVDATANADPFVEVSGILSAYAANLLKISSDLRLLASGPATGIGEIRLPALQAGSSIMPGKVNPVIPECVGQVALRVAANHQALTLAAGLGQLQINQFLPLVTQSLLESLRLLRQATRLFADKCVAGITVDEDRCRELVEKSHALATVLVPALGYEAVSKLMAEAEAKGVPLAEHLEAAGILSREAADALLSPKRMRKLGYEAGDYADVMASGENRGSAPDPAEGPRAPRTPHKGEEK
ncbi:fumarate lyase [Solidesulfovibrio fructosivorans JJ]]|uniref:Fumarate lyase n=1 Tax=Solidesulfovibrio fructosivorans JJ] TaxID=596151 RepID=E1JS03_SOLFR|nr:aspartate ammonia-lyase [Solidesulfovibrio fructosivorans]EFL52772.1 fumarate lyase [Solidesulfovibrio fructosivorans JJ]]